jgi:hypothetical protein
VHLNVLHAPVIESPTASGYLQAREGEEVEVTCTVHASPPPTVEWYRNGRLLAAADTVTATRGPNHTLIIPAIGGRATFGRYECRAVNSLGEAMHLTEVGGLADPAGFRAGLDIDLQEDADKGPTVAWVVRSLTPVVEFRLDYAPASPANKPWNSVSIESVTAAPGGANLYAGRHELVDLLAGVEYRVRVASRNAYGWSRPAEAAWTVKGRAAVMPAPPKPRINSLPAEATAAEVNTAVSADDHSKKASSSIRPSSLSSSPLSSSSSVPVAAATAVAMTAAMVSVLLSGRPYSV